jgi:hypothetical protein
MNKSNKVISGLGFGIFMAVFFILQSLFTTDSYTTNEVLKALISGLIGGTVAGVLFGWLSGILQKIKFKPETWQLELEEDETVLFQKPANHFKGVEGVGGQLYLTNKRLLFISHRLNVQNHRLSIPLTNIQNIEQYKTFGIVSNGLSIHTNKNTTERFVVQQADEWIRLMTQRPGNLQQAAF